MSNRCVRATVLSTAFLAVLPGLFGCPVVTRHNKGQVFHRTEPVCGERYELYVPSTYTGERKWPLVITCHGTPPFDSARLQVAEWTDLAERKGLIVAAPVLKGTRARGDSKPKAVARQIELQRYDEQTILATVNHVKAGYQIDEGKIYLTGWSAGNYAVLWTGLSHPESFRALAVRQGNFDARFLAPIEDRISPQQQVMVVYGQADLLRSQAAGCVRWLKQRGVTVFEDEVSGAHRRVSDLAWRYFEGITKGHPWLVARWEPSWGSDPLTVHLKVRADPPVEKLEWTLGDGQTSQATSLTHTYPRGGRYDVTVRATFPDKRQVERRLRLTVAPAASRETPATHPAPRAEP